MCSPTKTEQALPSCSGPLSGGSCLLMLEPCPVSVPSPQGGHRPHGFREMEFRRFTNSWKYETPSGLGVDILRHLGSYKGQMENELEPTLDKCQFCFLLILSFEELRLNPQVCLYLRVHVSPSCTCGFSLDSQQATFCTFCFLCHSPQHPAHGVLRLAGQLNPQACKGGEQSFRNPKDS